MTKSENFYKLFKPDLTPKQMLAYGVFGGSYLGETISEYPKSWFVKAKISKTFSVDLNYFQIRAGLNLKEWKKKLDYGRGSPGLVSMVLPLYCRKKNAGNRWDTN